MSKVSKYHGAQAENDFHKSNGSSTTVYNTEPSLTRQEFAEECDINVLMARTNAFVVGGPGMMAPREPLYFDFADTPQDLMGYLEFIKEAEDKFMALPAQVRKEFDNSAVEFVAYASDPDNLEQMRSWGLAPPAKAPEKPAAVEPPSAPAAPAGDLKAPAGASTHGST